MSVATPSRNETVTHLFAAVANPERVDMTRPREAAVADSGGDDHRSAATQPSFFDRLVDETRSEEEAAGAAMDFGGVEAMGHEDEDVEEDHRFAFDAVEEDELDIRWNDEPEVVASEPPPMTEQERQEERQNEILEKQSVLMELKRLQQHHGIKLSREYTMEDNLADMQFEIRRHLASVDEATSVKFMADGLKLMCTGLELANNKFGPFLELDGWSATVTSPENMPRYDSALSRLYRKYWGRRSTMSPEMELGFALVSSIMMHHFQKKAQGMLFGAPGGAPRSSRQPSPPMRPPPTNAASTPPASFSEGMPPPEARPPTGAASIPDSVPVSARKRLVF